MEDQRQSKNNNEKLILGIILGAILGFILYWSINMVAGFSENIFLILITVFITVIILFLVSIWGRKYVIRKLFGKNIDFDNVIEKSQVTINSITDNVSDILPLKIDTKEDIKKYAPKLISFLIWSKYRNWSLRVMISFLVALGSLVLTILTLNQNRLIEDQNRKIDQQTELINQQNILSESSRRSSQMFIMGEVLSDINKELNKIEESGENKERKLSGTLVGRIISLSKSMRPYKYIEIKDDSSNDSIKFSAPISPERGQLLITLLNSNIDPDFLELNIIGNNRIYSNNNICDFRYSDLTDMKIEDKQITFINLSFSNLRSSIFIDVNLQWAYLYKSRWEKASLDRVNLTYTKIINSNFNNSYSFTSDFFESEIQSSSFKKSRMFFTDFYNSTINNSDMSYSLFKECIFKNVSFLNSNLTSVVFDGSNLESANFQYASLKKADLRNSSLNNAILTNVISMDSVLVDRIDWIDYIKDSLKLKGAKEISKLYKVKKIKTYDSLKMKSEDTFIVLRRNIIK